MTSRIQLTDSMLAAIGKMVDGNIGATTVLMRLMKESESIDPQSAFGGFGKILSLDTHRIYGPDIWIFYKDVCRENLVLMLSVLRAIQLGLRGESWLKMKIETVRSGNDVMGGVEECYELVRAELPTFDPEGLGIG